MEECRWLKKDEETKNRFVSRQRAEINKNRLNYSLGNERYQIFFSHAHIEGEFVFCWYVLPKLCWMGDNLVMAESFIY